MTSQIPPSPADDKIAIQDALLRYCRGLDRKDLDMAKSAFHDDAQVVHGFFSGSGHDWVSYVIASPPVDRIGIGDADPAMDVAESQQHHITNQLIELDGDVAYSEAYFIEYTMSRRDARRFLTTVGGRYAERYERRQGQWRIAERKAVRDWDSVTPIDTRFPGWEKSPQGTRDHSDPSYWSGRAGIVPPAVESASRTVTTRRSSPIGEQS